MSRSSEESALHSAVHRFRAYPAYKDSGVEWLGEIPAGWEVKRLKDCVAQFISGGTPESGNPVYWTDELDGTPWVAISDMTRSFHVRDTAKRLTKFGLRSKRLPILPRGTLLYSMYASLGKVAVLEIDAVVNQAILGIATGVAGVSCDYLRWWLEFMQGHVQMLSSSSTQDNLNTEKVRSMPVVLSPASTQRAVATFLDRETARIDVLVARKERLISLLQERRTALITRAVTKGLDPAVPMKESGVEWLGEIPVHWEADRLRRVLFWIEQGWSPNCENREAEADEWGVLKAGCVNKGVFVASEHKALPSSESPPPELEIRRGDLLMSRASGSRELVGSVAVVPECRPRLLLCDKVYRLHVKQKQASSTFLAYALNSRAARAQIERVLSGGSGLASNIAQDVVKDLGVALPPHDEQQRIVAFLDDQAIRSDFMIDRIRTAITRLHELRTALISAAVTGKIDVREATP